MDTTESVSPFDQLENELRERGWIVSRDGDQLTVANPAVPALNDTVTVTETEFVYTWGPSLGLLTEVTGAADRITEVLRAVKQDARP